MLKWINKKRNKKGFTLVELVVVIAILGILAALAVPKLSGSRDKANQSAVLANLRTIESAIMLAETENGVSIGATEGQAIDQNDALKEYLNVIPTGPAGVEYSLTIIDGDTRAAVKLTSADMFGWNNTEGQILTLEGLIEE